MVVEQIREAPTRKPRGDDYLTYRRHFIATLVSEDGGGDADES